MQTSFLIAIIIVIPMSILSCFVILKKQSFVGEAISHSVLPGIIIAHIIGLPLEIGAFIAGMICTLFTGYLKEKSNFQEDILLSIVFSGMFAIGMIIMLKVQSSIHFNHILFGDMIGISKSRIIITVIFSLISVTFLILKRKDLLIMIFDPEYAHTMHIPIKLLHYIFLVILSLVIVISLKAIGIILPPAVLVLPGATAFLISQHHTTMILISVITSILCTLIGIYISFLLNSACAPTIVMLMSICFLISHLYSLNKNKINKKKKYILDNTK
ncbi:Manganese ABC transporter, inner membrane permease protein SitD [Candidatus Liberibacter americanus str. Sao Paulo]|uniref:Manganese ABC transporter, inner membrane permease protein SitD n=2 Tax=Candidatus Liberibacter americanus TaxID=309868 RepID=U6B937_9HYPH|nr:Manganese ABC transporter, inner membrane permease protein SitD [Candidatus Liberibacter americanus str. Sao Paulo]